ncbi:MAG: hypothetical protein HOQ18_08655 [Dermatophilaceae bacterium]|nr:hypothetical protein [Dermatophilaceae bacterium]NUO90877.1 hypothetical protein [Dermatophilaceae bacterium]NUR16994.1 hypothetical protein [Dermatophilaceae bacterium]NUR78984.1 hypothetical protein [Dermatophilaceae bacterium]
MSYLVLADVKEYLNISGTGSDTELPKVIARAEGALASKVGPLAPTSITAKVRGMGSALLPPVTPIASLTSVTPTGGTALPLSALVTPETGLRGPQRIEYASGTWFSAYWYDVVYQAGRTTVPDALTEAAYEMVELLWRSQRGNSPGAQNALPGDEQPAPDSRADMMPPHIQRLIAPYEQVWL